MVNFSDPGVIAQDLLAVTKLWHALGGLYIWEFVTTLDYEWSVIRRRRPYRWTIGIYSITRLATLMAVILSMLGIDVTTPFNCQVESVLQLLSGYVAFAAASLLIVLRIIAIWNGNKFAIALASGVWVTNLGFLTRSVVRIRTAWVPAMSTCVITNIHSTKLNLITTLTTDVVLLLIMLVGLLRLGFHESGVYGLGHLMWKQGLVWLFLATIAEVPPVVFISLDLNGRFSFLSSLSMMYTDHQT